MTDVHSYLAEFDDIPGTRVFTAARGAKGLSSQSVRDELDEGQEPRTLES